MIPSDTSAEYREMMAKSDAFNRTTAKTYGPRQRDWMSNDVNQVKFWSDQLYELLKWRPSSEREDIDAELVQRLAGVIAVVAQRIADVKPSKEAA